MKLYLLLLPLIVTAFAAPSRTQRSAEEIQEFIDQIATIKDPKHYDDLKEFRDLFLSIFIEVVGLEGERAHHYKTKLNDAVQVLHDFAKAAIVEGSNPTDEELGELGKRMSKTLQQVDLRSRMFGIPGERTVVNNHTIDVLKKIVAENPVKEHGNVFVEKFKEELPDVYVIANLLRRLQAHVKKEIEAGEPISKPATTSGEKEIVNVFLEEFFSDEVLALFGTEESAVEISKNIGILLHALKAPEAYDSLKSLYQHLARSKRLEAWAILIRELGKCIAKPLSDETKAKFNNHIGGFLKILRAMLADRQNVNVDELTQIRDEYLEKDHRELLMVIMEIGGHYRTKESCLELCKCLVNDDVRKVFREALTMTDTVYTDEQLEEIRAKSPVVYAVVRIYNGFIKAVRARKGLGPEADAFFKQAATTPHALLRLAKVMKPCPETIEKIKAAKKQMIEKFNALSPEAKKEIVDMFPYRTIFALSALP